MLMSLSVNLGAIARTNAYFGQGSSTSPILLQRLGCSGTESRLVDCRHSGVGVVSSFCGHGDDAGVTCRVIPRK